MPRVVAGVEIVNLLLYVAVPGSDLDQDGKYMK